MLPGSVDEADEADEARGGGSDSDPAPNTGRSCSVQCSRSTLHSSAWSRSASRASPLMWATAEVSAASMSGALAESERRERSLASIPSAGVDDECTTAPVTPKPVEKCGADEEENMLMLDARAASGELEGALMALYFLEVDAAIAAERGMRLTHSDAMAPSKGATAEEENVSRSDG